MARLLSILLLTACAHTPGRQSLDNDIVITAVGVVVAACGVVAMHASERRDDLGPQDGIGPVFAIGGGIMALVGAARILGDVKPPPPR
jgi:hypothetical protein